MGLGFTHTSPGVLLRRDAVPFLGGEEMETIPGAITYCPCKCADPRSESCPTQQEQALRIPSALACFSQTAFICVYLLAPESGH